MTELTREQVLDQLGVLQHSGFEQRRIITQQLAATDAALRAQVVYEQERNSNNVNGKDQELSELRAQLAQVTAERNAQLADATEAWSTVNDRDQTILARDEQLETLQHQLASYRERLEIGFAYDVDGKRVELPYQELGKCIDGIDCRDDTIKLIEQANKELKHQLADVSNQLEGANNRFERDQQRLAEAQARIVKLSYRCLHAEPLPELLMGLSNFDHRIEEGCAEGLSGGRTMANYAGWNFHAYVYKVEERFVADVHVYHHHASFEHAETLEALMQIVSAKYGDD